MGPINDYDTHPLVPRIQMSLNALRAGSRVLQLTAREVFLPEPVGPWLCIRSLLMSAWDEYLD
jgi:hypothetical protein